MASGICSFLFFFFLMIRRPPRSTLFPYTTPSDLIRKMGGLWNKVPVTHWVFLIGTAAIAGFPFLSGWWSKDEIRSEEHTSELQSQSNLVCRLLLEKKKIYNTHRVCPTT